MSLLERARALLTANGALWTTISGSLQSRYDEYVCDIGRSRYHGEAFTGSPRDFQNTELEYRIWCTHEPWRLRLDLSSDVGGSDDAEPTTTVIDGRIWWTLSDGNLEVGEMQPDGIITDLEGSRTAIYRGETYPNPASRYVTPGTENLGDLVEPAKWTAAFTLHDAEETRIAGRPAIQLRAEPIPGDAFLLKAPPGIVVLGATEYSLTVDIASGILVAWDAYIDGHFARRQYFTELTTNQPLASDLFLPPQIIPT